MITFESYEKLRMKMITLDSSSEEEFKKIADKYRIMGVEMMEQSWKMLVFYDLGEETEDEENEEEKEDEELDDYGIAIYRAIDR